MCGSRLKAPIIGWLVPWFPGSARGPARAPPRPRARAAPILVAVNDTEGRRVASRLVAEVRAPAELVLQVAVSGLAGATVADDLTITLDGQPQPAAEIAAPGPSRIHLLAPDPARLIVKCQATVTGHAAAPEVTEADRLSYLRPSRYAESDRLGAVARSQFGGITARPHLPAAGS